MNKKLLLGLGSLGVLVLGVVDGVGIYFATQHNSPSKNVYFIYNNQGYSTEEAAKQAWLADHPPTSDIVSVGLKSILPSGIVGSLTKKTFTVDRAGGAALTLQAAKAKLSLGSGTVSGIDGVVGVTGTPRVGILPSSPSNGDKVTVGLKTYTYYDGTTLVDGALQNSGFFTTVPTTVGASPVTIDAALVGKTTVQNPLLITRKDGSTIIFKPKDIVTYNVGSFKLDGATKTKAELKALFENSDNAGHAVFNELDYPKATIFGKGIQWKNEGTGHWKKYQYGSEIAANKTVDDYFAILESHVFNANKEFTINLLNFGASHTQAELALVPGAAIHSSGYELEFSNAPNIIVDIPFAVTFLKTSIKGSFTVDGNTYTHYEKNKIIKTALTNTGWYSTKPTDNNAGPDIPTNIYEKADGSLTDVVADAVYDGKVVEVINDQVKTSNISFDSNVIGNVVSDSQQKGSSTPTAGFEQATIDNMFEVTVAPKVFTIADAPAMTKKTTTKTLPTGEGWDPSSL